MNLDKIDIDMFKTHLYEKPKKNKTEIILDSDKLKTEDVINFLRYKSFIKNEDEDESLKQFNRDLEIFEGLEDKTASVLSKINKTSTSFGYLKLIQALSHPTTNIDTLKNQQDIIKRISNLNESEKKDIEQKLTRLSELEKDVVWLLKPKTLEEQDIISGVYFNEQYTGTLNKYEEPLNIYSYFKIFLSPLYGLLSPLLMMILPYLYLRFFSKIKISFWSYIKILKMSMFSDVFSFMGGGGATGRSKYSKYFSFFLSMVFYIQNLVNSFNISFTTEKIIQILHTKLNHFQEFCEKTIKLSNGLKEKLNLTELEYPDNYIKDTPFEKSPSLFSNKGKVLYANKNCLEYNKSEGLLDQLGIIDYYFSLFKLTEKYDTCYPKMLDNKKPILDYNNLYHPYLEKKAVKNNIIIGNKYPSNVIITGPNAGGKSTMIKSIAISLLTSQTIGLAFANDFSFTPFELLNSYLNIPDCKGKESLFELNL